MPEDVVEGQIDCMVYRPIGSVGKLQGVQEGVSDVFEVRKHKALKGLHNHRGQGDGSEVVKSCGPWLLGNRDDG